jgi:predicted transcriptional regulator
MSAPELPPVMTTTEVAQFFRVSLATVYRHPKNFGGKKIRGKGFWKFPRDTVLRIAGYELGEVTK